MSKDVVIAGVIVAACLGLVTVAFVVPRHKTSTTDIASTDTGTSEFSPTTPNTNTNPDPFAPDPFAPNNNNVATNNNTNPFAPINPAPNNNFPPTNNNYPPGNNNTFPPIDPPANNFPPTNLPPITQPVEPVLPVTNTNEEKTHVVASGETLGEISQKYYNTARNWKKIAEANKVDPNEIQVGQKLKIPVIESAAPVSTGTPIPLASGERSYTIQKGDSYYRIAQKELGNAARWKEVEKLNNIPAEDLRVGKVIKLPAKEASVPGLPTTTTNNTGSDGKTHVVATGETLSDISKKYYGTTTKWREIVKANPGIDPEGLRVGQKVKLPDIASSAPSAANTNTTTEQGNYTVKAGDTLGSIAERELGKSDDWKKIVEANPGLDPRKLRIGQKIMIPGKSGGTTPPPAESGFGDPNTNSGFGQPGTDNNSGFGNGSNNAGNSFAPTTFPSNDTPSNDFGSGSGDSNYPSAPSGNPPSGSPYPEPSSLPDSFGGSSGFNNSP